jgi:diacylglycerol kinase (ATP)
MRRLIRNGTKFSMTTESTETREGINRDSEAMPKLTGVFRSLFAVRNSINGFKSAWREESSFRQEVILFLLFSPLPLVLDIPPIQRLLLAVTVLLVLLVELINSSIEATIDRISLERHELSARAKDCGSAAVTLALLICALTWGTICFPLLLRWMHW